jgi:DNA-binding transcriptional regulator PaaX
MGWDDISIQISIKSGLHEFRAVRVVSPNQLPLDFGPIDWPTENVEDFYFDDIYCTPEKTREKIMKYREHISKALAEEIMNFFGRDDTKGGYKP